MVCYSTMTSNDLGAVLGSVKWCDEGSYVKEIAEMVHLPQLAKVIKGQYLSVGVPSLTNSGVAPSILLFSPGKSIKVLAQCVKFKDGRKVVTVGPKLVIPESYDGYFEILSEDGRAVRCIESVCELCKRFPDSCLVREPIKAFVSKSDDIETITEKYRHVQMGETLILVGEVVGSKKYKFPRFLRCFDQSGQNVYFPYDTKGKFSAIAKEDNISGVHSIKNLLNKRLPLMVRLIHGHSPIGHKISSQFLPELRLFTSFTEETLAALPLGKDSPAILIPYSAPLKLTLPKNIEEIQKSKVFLKVCERSGSFVQDLSEKIQIYDVNIGSKSNLIKDPRFFHVSNQHKPKSTYAYLRKTLVSKPPERHLVSKKTVKSSDEYDEIDQIYDYVRGIAPLPKHLRFPHINKDYNLNNRRSSAPSKFIEKDSRPLPIEPIPSRRSIANLHEKLSPSVHPALISAVLEKAERNYDKKDKTLPDNKPSVVSYDSPSLIRIHKTSFESRLTNKLFVKAQQKSAKSRMLKHKTSPLYKDSVECKTEVKSNSRINSKLSAPNHIRGSTQSLFKLRYKSLNNLSLNFDTLDSSTSAEKGSLPSSTSIPLQTKILRKRSSKLPRPKSLTNLVWDSRGSSTGGDSGFAGMGNAGKALLEAERKLRLEPGVYRHPKDAPALLAATNRMLASQRKIGTLYL